MMVFVCVLVCVMMNFYVVRLLLLGVISAGHHHATWHMACDGAPRNGMRELPSDERQLTYRTYIIACPELTT